MDFRELSYILAIARYQNISKAAESLFVTQPTLSKCLISLEARLDQKLFQRTGNKYTLTYAGRVFVEKANQLMSLKADLEHELEDIKNTGSDELSIALPSMRCAYMLPVILPAFHKNYPNVRINVYEGSSSENRRRLLEGEALMGFSGMPMEKHPALTYESLWKEELVIILPENHPLAASSVICPGYPYPVLDPFLLKDELFLNLMPYQRTRQIVDAFLSERHLVFDNTITTGSLSAVIDLVASGYGVTMAFDGPQIHRSMTGNISCFCLENRIIHDFTSVTRKNSYIPASAHNFTELMKHLHEEGKL